MDPAIRPRHARLLRVRARLTHVVEYLIEDPGDGADLTATIGPLAPIATGPGELEVLDAVEV